jgi:hypothetical protein
LVAARFIVTGHARLPRSGLVQWTLCRRRHNVHKHRNLLAHAPDALHEAFKRRIKTQTVLPSAETAATLFWALLACSQITMRKVDGWQSLGEPPASLPLDLVA